MSVRDFIFLGGEPSVDATLGRQKSIDSLEFEEDVAFADSGDMTVVSSAVLLVIGAPLIHLH